MRLRQGDNAENIILLDAERIEKCVEVLSSGSASEIISVYS